MRVWNGSLLSGSAAATTPSTGSWLGHIVYGSFQCNVSASAAGCIGSMSLQFSNEAGRNASEAEIVLTTGINNWVTVGTPTPINVAASQTGSIIVNVPELGYRWVRPVWINQAGGGSVEILATLKGW